MTFRITDTHLTLTSDFPEDPGIFEVVSVEDSATPEYAIGLRTDGEPRPLQLTDEEATALADCLHQLVADRVDASIRAGVQAAQASHDRD